MSKEQMTEYRRKLGEFFYPFLGNIELGNISALENTKLLVDVFISFNEVGYFIHPYSEEDTETITRGKRMKLCEMPEQVQVVAARLLAEKISEHTPMGLENRTEMAEKIAETVRKAFECLYN